MEAPRRQWAEQEPVLKLDANESPLPAPEWLRRALVEAAARIEPERYPDRTYADLRESVGAAYRVPAAAVSVGNGSGEVLLNAFVALRERVRRAVWPWPTFGLYRALARRAGLPYDEVSTPLAAALEPDRLLAAGQGEPALYVLARPDNPSGALWPRAAVEAVAGGMAPGSILLVDEAYAEFAGDTLMPWALERPDVLVVRTLSKAYGLAGLRVGFAVGAPALTGCLEAARLPYPLDGLTVAVARAALARRAEVEAAARTVAAWRGRLAAALRSVAGLEVREGAANFLLVRAPDGDGDGLRRRLAELGVLVRAYPDEPMLAAWVRVSACRPEAIPRVARAFAAAVGQPAGRRAAGDEEAAEG